MYPELTEVMIFAAGFGTRMKKLTVSIPKPLIKVGSKTLIDHTLSLLQKPNMTAIVNTHYKHELIRKHLRKYSNVTVIVEEPNIYETGGGLKNALPLIKSDAIFTLNSDSIYKGNNPLGVLEKAWDPTYMEALLLLAPQEKNLDHPKKGDFSIDQNNLLKRTNSGSIYTGAQIIKTNRFSKMNLTNFSLNIMWDKMISEKTIYGLEYSGSWIDVGTPVGIKKAEKLLKVP
jgi:MurNAc alpha-1-phosphate uridylyltransferase